MAIIVNTAKTEKNKTVTREITVSEPLDGSSFKKHRVLFTFEIIGKNEAKGLSDEELMQRVVKGWGDSAREGKGGFEDEQGNPIPFSEQALAQYADVPWVAAGIVKGYLDIAFGGKLGN